MQTVQGNMLLSLQNVQKFLGEHATVLGGVVSTGTRQLLDDALAELSDHAAVQDRQMRAATSAIARREAKRDALLRDHMAPITKIARLELAGTPELISILSLPNDRPTAERLAAIADGMAQAAAPFAEVFIRAGLRPDFVQALRAAAKEMIDALQDRTQSKGRVRHATAALKSKLSRGRKVVHVLDAFVKSALAGNPDLLSGWNLVKRVPRPRNGGSSAVPSPGSPSTAGA